MTIMNRRDDLLGMDAVAGTMASRRFEVLASLSQKNLRRRTRSEQSKIFVESGPRQFDLLRQNR